MTVISWLSAVLLLLSMLSLVGGVVALLRVPDALSRANVQTIISGITMPLLLVALTLYQWQTTGELHLLRAVVAIAGLLGVTAVAGFYVGRAIYGVSVVDAAVLAQESAGDRP